MKTISADACPISKLFNFLGKKWMIILIKVLGEHEELSFTQIQKKLDNINSRILTERLDEGVEAGYILRNVTSTKPLKIRYSVTKNGAALSKKVEELAHFAQSHS
ncbi:HTH-type transcriptional regulator YodB [candidate division SR1 bacterium Aalborg_AAW-1]|nr:HTH-type transcriptional regulator YodB [candidate division SR1 bacterium Aalborg_AAW-1]